MSTEITEWEPILDRVLIKPNPPEETAGGLDLLEGDQEKKFEGLIVAVGTGVPLHNIKLEVTGDVSEKTLEALKEVIELIQKGRPMRVKPGDVVMFGRYAGTRVFIGGEEHLMMREGDVFMIKK
jgi:chaperonin GroES